MKKGERIGCFNGIGAKRLDFKLDDASPLILSWSRYGKPLERPSFDMHFALEFGFVLEGSIRRIYTERMDGVECGEGDAWLCDIWEPHGVSIDKAPAELLVAVIWPPALSALRCPGPSGLPMSAPFSAPLAKRPAVQDRIKPRLAAAARELMACDMESPFGRFRAWHRLLDMLSLVMEGWRHGKAPSLAPKRDPSLRASLAPALELVFSKRRPVSLAEGAAACGMGRTKFAALFLEMMGDSFASFGLKHRLGLAVKAMLDGNMALKDAAFAGGFSDASHFHRVFVRSFGRTPEEYRRMHLLKAPL